MHHGGRLLHVRELGVDRCVPEAARDDSPVRRLVPVVEAVASVVRDLEPALRDRLGRDHLPARRHDQTLEVSEQATRIPVGTDDHGGFARVRERRHPLTLTDLDTLASCERGEPADEACRLQGRVTGMAEDRGVSTLERPLEVVEPFGVEAVLDERGELGAELDALLLVDGNPEAAEPSQSIAGKRLQLIDGLLGGAPERLRSLTADRRARHVVRGGRATECEAPVPAACAAGDLAGILQADA